MILPRFELAEPTSVGDACQILRQHPTAKVIAGGTDLLVNLKRKVLAADLLVSLGRVPGMNDGNLAGGEVVFGPLMTVATLAESPEIRKSFPVLSMAAGKLGSMQIRNRATIGGNICTARPAGDTIGALVAYGAIAQISGPSGQRTESFATLFKGPGKTSLKADEILTGVSIKKPVGDSRGSYVKYTIRNAMEIALVSVTTLLTMERGTCTSARVVLGAVAPTFVRCQVTEAFLVGKKINEETAEKAGKLVIDACSPITDLRATADYRTSLVQTLVKRSLLESVSGNKN